MKNKNKVLNELIVYFELNKWSYITYAIKKNKN